MPQNLMSMNDAIKAGYGSRSKLTRLIDENKLPAVRNGRFIFFRREDLDALYKPMNPSAEDAYLKLAKEIAKSAPKLTSEGKRQLAELLGA